MLKVIKYTASWVHYKLQVKLGQRGAEMIEYALVLSCIAILGYWFYGSKPGNSADPYNALRITTLVPRIWRKISQFIATAQQ